MRGDERRRRRIALLALLVWSLGLRLWVAEADRTHRKIYDERFSVRNVAWILESGRLAPENGFHPSLSYLPHLLPLAASHGLHRLTGWEPARVLSRGPGNEIGRTGAADGLGLTPAGYRLARGVNCLFGTLSVWLCYLVAQRIFGPQTGLLAAWLLASTPWHLRQSAAFKPDIVLVAALLTAFYCALLALERRSWVAYAVAGAGIGLCLSSKFNAAPAAVPLLLGSLWQLREDRAALARLALAASASIATLLLLNPHLVLEFGLYEHDFGATLRDYARKGRMAGATRWEALLSAPLWLSRGVFHGPLIGLLAAVGAAAQAVSLARRRGDRQLERALLLAFPIGYILVYVFATQNPGGWHNWLVLAPFTAILAGWAGWAGWLRLRATLPAAAVAPAAVAGWAAMVLVPGLPALDFAHREAVPETRVVAAELLRRELGNQPGRIVVQELPVPVPVSFARGRAVRPAGLIVDSLARVAEERLDLADAELFDGTRLAGERREFLRRRVERLDPTRVHRVRSGWFRGRGRELWLLLHPFRAAAPEAWLALERGRRRRPRFSARVRHQAGAPLTSFGLWMTAEPGGETAAVLEAAGRRLELAPAHGSAEAAFLVSERIVLPRGGARVVLRLGRPSDQTSYPLAVYRWRPSAGR